MICISQRLVLAFVMIYATAGEGHSGRTDVVENLESIFLRLYTGTTPDEYVDYSLDKVGALQTKLIDDRRTMLYIHGYTEHLEKRSVRTMIQAYVKRNDHNVIAVSYVKLGNESYTKVVKNIPHVGAALALVLNSMVQRGFDPETLHIIGHSMGAQVAGHIGKRTNFQVPRITGLDPAGPLFNIFESRLTLTDARFVDIIHTDYGLYGMTRTGTMDFYPNGGRRVQPGCPQNYSFYDDDEFCSHNRSWQFYAESVNNVSSFLGIQCPSWSRFLSGECNNHTRVIMGYGTSNRTNGSVYLLTASQSPFGLREKGARIIAA